LFGKILLDIDFEFRYLNRRGTDRKLSSRGNLKAEQAEG
jgi:hypothetical protein